MDLGSNHTQTVLNKHRNFEAHHHPDGATNPKTLFRWSHHEKIVIVDGSIAFVGGIGLAFVR